MAEVTPPPPWQGGGVTRQRRWVSMATGAQGQRQDGHWPSWRSAKGSGRIGGRRSPDPRAGGALFFKPFPVGENSPQREMLQFRARHTQFEPRLKIATPLFLIQLLKASIRVKHRRRQSFRRPQRLVLTEAWLGRA